MLYKHGGEEEGPEEEGEEEELEMEEVRGSCLTFEMSRRRKKGHHEL